MARMKKVDLIAKIAKEQNLDPKQLERLPMLELEKMDKVVPDIEGSDILGGDDDMVSPTGASDSSVVAQDSVSDAPVSPSSIGSDEVAAGPGTCTDIKPAVVQPATRATTTTAGEEKAQEKKTPKVIGNHPVTGNPVYDQTH